MIMLGIKFCTAMLGMFIAVPLFVLARNRSANMWLGMFVFSLASLCLAELYMDQEQLFGWFDWPLALLGPSFYCYVRSMVGLGVSRRHAWHFLPLLLWVGFLLYMRLTMPFGYRGPFMWGMFSLALLAFQLGCFAYAFATLYMMLRHRRRVRENFSSARKRDLNWLTWLSAAILFLLIVWIPAIMIGGIFSWLLGLGRLGLLYLLGWYGLRSLPVFMPQLNPPPPAAPAPGAPAPVPEEAEKYARSGMTDSVSDMIGERLQRRIAQHRDFLATDISLAELAGLIGTTPQLLSQYLNKVLGLNFFDYINGLRVAEVQKRMLEPAHAGITLLDLALACGFNSKSTFNASFKRVSGLAPSAWRARNAA
ncbi:MAG: AraC family transcriptional regulator [Pseudomonadota bacterium]